MFKLLTLVSLLLSATPSVVRASPCLAMDSSFNLLVFGLGGKDFNAGTQDQWTGSTPAKDITTTGRPPFDMANTTCYLAQFFDAVYALNADSSDPSAVYIYDPKGAAWSKQEVTIPTGGSGPVFDPTSFKTILDHDTNVFYALSGGEVFFLDMGSLTTANSSALTWTDVGKPSFDTTNYQPVMALAQNHIHFLDVPGLQAGQADIFVIHFSFFQPTPQSYPVNGGGNFPEQHGQAVSFFQPSDVQQEFAFIPDDGSNTYVVNVESNTTQALAGPTTKDSAAQYFAGITSLVQLDSKGNIMFLPYQEGQDSTNAQAAWTKLTTITAPPANSTSNSTPSGGSSSSGNGTGTASANGASSTGGSNTGNTSGASPNGVFSLPALAAVGCIVACVLL